MKAAHEKALTSRYVYFQRWYFDRIVVWDNLNCKEIVIPLPAKIQEAIKSAYNAGKSDAIKKIKEALEIK
jgi:hypothetical protein